MLVTDFWIGGKDVTVKDIWQWINGDMMDMTKWHSDQPEGSRVENCAVLKYDESGNKFHIGIFPHKHSAMEFVFHK
jgi:hypothetical protein